MKIRLAISLFALLALLAGILSFSSAAAGPPAAPPPLAGKDWPNYGGGLYNQRYSTLDQINTSNVKNLKGAWTFHAKFGDKSSSFEASPIVIDGVMYVTSGRDDVWALNAKTGDMMWEYHPNIDTTAIAVCCGIVNRGVAVGNGKIFVGQVDGKLVALDQHTGQKAWEVEVGSPKDGYSETMAPQFFDGLVIIGISGAEYENRGYVTAYNADNGKQVWRWYSIPAPGEQGSDTWPSGSDIWRHGGGSMWMTPAIDPELGSVYISVGNPGPDLDGTVRKGDNLYTESIVALDVKTGKYRWHFQTVHHDIWDYDTTSPAVLFDTTINGTAVKGLAEAAKTGWVYLLDRTNGKPLVPINEKSVPQDAKQNTAATQPYPDGDPFTLQDATGLTGPYPKGKIFAPFENLPVLILPGANGGNEWSPISYNPNTNLVYIDDIQQPQIFTFNPSEIEQGKLKLGSSFTTPPGQETSGNLVAVDVRTNKIAWKKPQKFMMIGGTTTTAGGLVFAGQGDGNFEAYEAKTGDRLWQFQTGAGANAAPSVYEVDGEEFVAVASGGNFQLDFPRGDTLWVFSLKGSLGPVAAPPEPSTKPEAAVIGAAVTSNNLTIQDFKFTPSNNVVRVGTTVTFKNIGGAFPHSATSDDGKTFDTKVLQVGQSATVTFNQVGKFTYHCTPHPWMVGVIEVVAADAPLPAAAPTTAPATPSTTPATGGSTPTPDSLLLVVAGLVIVGVGALILSRRPGSRR